MRFGKQDAMGNIIVTPDLANVHRLAQKKLVELKKSGVKPLDAVNQAEDFARNVENRFWQYMEKVKDKKEKENLRRTFKKKYGYVPRTKLR